MATMTVGLQILPNGKDAHTHGGIDHILDVVKGSGLSYVIGPMETVIEGELHEVMSVVQKAQQVCVDAPDVEEFSATIKTHYCASGISIEEKTK
ncbi:thiamine-binding protein [Bacillaceae bacterium SIJ1]|uniref:thiamine-binding protein n=1 Tax=Litoribacterium kuwaitense TaxID=1398745 RepID=UPI0013EC3B38|nr:thiamine-binding protein [Litoribacterium kuwaitense]NGP44658.1 thiamine-binding protein [Litoribacterium kuwaitense]